MQIVKVHNYRKLLHGVRTGPKNAVIVFTSPAPHSTNLKARLADMKDVGINVFDIPYDNNRKIAELFEIRCIPTAVLVEHGMPIARATGFSEMDQFVQDVRDTVLYDKNSFE